MRFWRDVGEAMMEAFDIQHLLDTLRQSKARVWR